MTNNAVLFRPMSPKSSSSYAVISLTSFISNGASLAPHDTKIDFAVFPETKCQGLFSTPYISLHEKSHCRFLHNGYKVMFYSLLITGNLMPKLKVSVAL